MGVSSTITVFLRKLLLFTVHCTLRLLWYEQHQSELRISTYNIDKNTLVSKHKHWYFFCWFYLIIYTLNSIWLSWYMMITEFSPHRTLLSKIINFFSIFHIPLNVSSKQTLEPLLFSLSVFGFMWHSSASCRGSG
jgi:hypothetical protein